MRRFLTLLILFGCCGLFPGFYLFKSIHEISKTVPILPIIRRHLLVEIKTVGELEAARSMIIASSIKGDLGKIINLIADGVTVQPGEVLIKMDTSPFEEKIEKLQAQIKEQEACFKALEHALEWEKSQAEHENRTAAYEVETAQLELDKIVYGDGPQETSRLKGVMQKAWLKYEELNAYSHDLMELEAQGFLNPVEVKQAQKKLGEKQETYEMAKQQYESYVKHVFPMQVKKAETSLKRAQMNKEETVKSGVYKVAKSVALVEQSDQVLADSWMQLHEAENELIQTEIIAPASGMVVHREDFRSGQRRKPRVGDILVKNQPLLDLPDLSSMVVKTRVREVDLFKVAVGKKATIEVDAYPHLGLKGTISAIGVLALADCVRTSEEKYFEVRIALDESCSCLRPGMTARTTIHAQESDSVLTIPLQAVFEEKKQNFCYVVCPAKDYEKREIQLGMSNEQWVEVKSGLKEGEHVSLLNPTH